MATLTTLLAILLVITGVVGLVVPFLPSTPLILAAALVYDVGFGWQALGPLWLAVLCALMLVAEIGQRWLSHLGAKRGGASWPAVLVGLVLSVIGTFFFPPFGFFIGAIVGVVGTELLRSRDARHAAKAGSGWIVGWVLSLLLEGSIALVMVGIMLWQGAR